MLIWTIVSVASILVMLVCLAIVDSRMLPAALWLRSGLISFAAAATGAAAWLLLGGGLVQGIEHLFVPIAALGGVAAFLATLTVRGTGARIPAVLIFGFIWSALVFVPTAAVSFGRLALPFGLAPVDHGGSLAVNVAAGAAALGVLVAGGTRAPRLRSATVSLDSGTAAAIALTIGWIAWLAAAEFSVDDATPAIVLNGLVGAVGGAIGWLAVERIRHRRTTVAGVAGGLISGLAAITAGAPLFTPVSAAAAGVLSGALACIFTLQRVSATRRQQWFIVGSHLVAGGAGLVFLGLLASGFGFLFTGQLRVIQGQLVSTALVASYSTGVSFVLWSGLRMVAIRATRRLVEA